MLTSFVSAAVAVVLVAVPATVFGQTATLAVPATPVITAPTSVAAAPAIPSLVSPNIVANGDMISTLTASGKFTVLVKAIDSVNLTSVLKGTPGLTLFAPTDDAFRALPPSQLSQLMAKSNAATLQRLLVYHLVNLSLDSSKIRGAKGPVPTVEQSQLVVDGSANVLKVNDANIIQADIHATNGIIHVVDKVLVPSDITLPTATAAAPPTTATGG